MRVAIRLFTAFLTLFFLLLPAGAVHAAPAVVYGGSFVEEHINTCNDELVTLAGTWQVVQNSSDNGVTVGQLTVRAHGVGDQGNRYVWHVKEIVMLDANPVLVQRHELVSLGSAPNQQIRLFLNYATGDIVIETVCTG